MAGCCKALLSSQAPPRQRPRPAVVTELATVHTVAGSLTHYTHRAALAPLAAQNGSRNDTQRSRKACSTVLGYSAASHGQRARSAHNITHGIGRRHSRGLHTTPRHTVARHVTQRILMVAFKSPRWRILNRNTSISVCESHCKWLAWLHDLRPRPPASMIRGS